MLFKLKFIRLFRFFKSGLFLKKNRKVNPFSFINFIYFTNGGNEIIVEFGNFPIIKVNEIDNNFGKSVKNDVLKLRITNINPIIKILKPGKVINNIIFVFKICIFFLIFKRLGEIIKSVTDKGIISFLNIGNIKAFGIPYP